MLDNGDSTLILTPFDKKILIDAGGSELNKKYDVGENVVLPYLLNRKINKLDYIMISHFDSDHCLGMIYLLENIKVDNVIISKQFENSENYLKIMEIIKRKNIKIIIAKGGEKIKIDNYTYFDILWPIEEKKISENAINNNSIVAKFNYFKFNIIFTGDIEEKAEEVIYKEYKDTNKLKSNILKIAHHGSKTSTTNNFLNETCSKICLIRCSEKKINLGIQIKIF